VSDVEQIAAMNDRFRLPSGEIDLLAMSNTIPTEEFDDYVRLCRGRRLMWRLMRPIIIGPLTRSARADAN
jgi:hypothetical protein